MRPGVTIDSVAELAGVAPSRVKYLLPLTHLGPAALRAVLTGRLGQAVALKDLVAAAEHLDWSRQAQLLRSPNTVK